MNIGEMQRLLSLEAERSKGHRFDDLYALVCHADWLRQAHARVANNIGSRTAGCDGINMKDFDENLEDNLHQLREDLLAGAVNANFLENTETLCKVCHDKKTELDRQVESRVQ
jgi:hypothetical protein